MHVNAKIIKRKDVPFFPTTTQQDKLKDHPVYNELRTKMGTMKCDAREDVPYFTPYVPPVRRFVSDVAIEFPMRATSFTSFTSPTPPTGLTEFPIRATPIDYYQQAKNEEERIKETNPPARPFSFQELLEAKVEGFRRRNPL